MSARIGFRVTDEDVADAKPASIFELDGQLPPESKKIQHAVGWSKVERRDPRSFSSGVATSIDEETFPVGIRDGRIYVPWMNLGGILTGPPPALTEALEHDENIELVQSALRSESIQSHRKRVMSRSTDAYEERFAKQSRIFGTGDVWKDLNALCSIDRLPFDENECRRLLEFTSRIVGRLDPASIEESRKIDIFGEGGERCVLRPVDTLSVSVVAASLVALGVKAPDAPSIRIDRSGVFPRSNAHGSVMRWIIDTYIEGGVDLSRLLHHSIEWFLTHSIGQYDYEIVIDLVRKMRPISNLDEFYDHVEIVMKVNPYIQDAFGNINDGCAKIATVLLDRATAFSNALRGSTVGPDSAPRNAKIYLERNLRRVAKGIAPGGSALS